jgi:O-antigen ligase
MKYIFDFLYRKIRLSDLTVVSRNIIFIYLIFLVGLTVSFIGVPNFKAAIIELLAYIYGFLIMIVFSVYISQRKEKAIQVIYWGFLVSLIPIALTATLYFTDFPLRSFVTKANNRFYFFTVHSNQLAMYIIICLSVFFITANSLKSKILNTLLIVVVPVLIIIVSLIAQSRTGVFISIILTMLIFIKNISKVKKEVFIGLLIIGIIFIAMNTAHFKRALTVFDRISSGMIINDFREANFSKALEAFYIQPVNGIGLGNFRGIWHSRFEIHNSFLSILTETGLIGFIPFLVFILWWMKKVLIDFNAQWKNRIQYFIMILALFIFYFQHHVLRERWCWIFIVYSVLISEFYFTGFKTNANKKV